VERLHRQRVLEHLVEVGRRADAVLHQVQVIIRVDRRELAAHQQRVAVADEDGFDGGEIFGGLHEK
jgi:hypothetical protein